MGEGWDTRRDSDSTVAMDGRTRDVRAKDNLGIQGGDTSERLVSARELSCIWLEPLWSPRSPSTFFSLRRLQKEVSVFAMDNFIT